MRAFCKLVYTTCFGAGGALTGVAGNLLHGILTPISPFVYQFSAKRCVFTGDASNALLIWGGVNSAKMQTLHVEDH